MPVITLPDGSQRTFEQPVTVAEVAADIGVGLAKAALAGKVDGRPVDTAFRIENDAEVALLTTRDEEGIEVLRHSTAHLLAQAVKELYPETQITIGPIVENGFYYDLAREEKFTPDDLTQLEKKMEELAKQSLPIGRIEMERDDAVKFFRDQGEEYKAEIIESIPQNEVLSLYKQGDFTDLCRGPHVPNTSYLKGGFKLMKLAGAYWRGDSNNEMLQRIYGVAFADKKQLKQYLHQLEEAEKRDHRKIGKKLDLFHSQEEAPGMIFWHAKGWSIYCEVKEYVRKKLRSHDYEEVHTPQVIDRVLWEKSGHWDKFGDMIFTTHSENRDYAIKPMNCPGHIQIYNQRIHSYRDLPLRLAEFGACHRNEPSGTLHGLMRVRNFTQDDGHIFCAQNQIQSEVAAFMDLLFEVYEDFGFKDVLIKLSTRPEKRVGSDEVWDQAEQSLEEALNRRGLDWDLQPGEGAFYGPKIEFSLKDCIGRVWQCGTIQVDFSMPERLEATYIDESGQKQNPVMLHRAVLGSLERFVGILIEEYAGAMPVWLSPVQAVIVNVTDHQREYAEKVEKMLKNAGFRVEADLRNEKVGFKIREHSMQRVPYILVIGDRERDTGSVTVRIRGGEDLGSFPMDEFLVRLEEDVKLRR